MNEHHNVESKTFSGPFMSQTLGFGILVFKENSSLA